MSWKESTVEIITTPWIVLSSALGSVFGLFGLEPIVSFITSLSMQWFAPLAIGAGTLAPNLEWLPQDAFMGVFLGVAVVVFLARADQTVEWMRDKYT